MALLSLLAMPAQGAEIKVVSVTATGLIEALLQVSRDFERATGHTLVAQFDLTPDLLERLDAGQSFDVIVLTPAVIDDLIQKKHVARGARVDFARTGIGVCVRPGTRKPDISSVEAFRRALLAARRITYNPDVASGRHVVGVLERLGISDQMRSRTLSAANAPGPGKVVGVVARGEADLGLVIITDIISDSGCELVGPLPAPLQSSTTFTAAISSQARNIDAARALLMFLTTPTARAALVAAGMEVERQP